jgi:hypothetical protein
MHMVLHHCVLFLSIALSIRICYYLETSVEARGESAEGVENVWFSGHLFVHHQSKDSHLSCPSLVKLDSSLVGELFFGSTPLEHAVSQVTREFVSGVVLHDVELKESDESNNLKESGGRDVGNSGKSGLDGSEGMSGEVNVSGQTNTIGSGDVSQDGKHGNTSVLHLNITKTVESLLVNTIQQVQGIPRDSRKRKNERQKIFDLGSAAKERQGEKRTRNPRAFAHQEHRRRQPKKWMHSIASKEQRRQRC